MEEDPSVSHVKSLRCGCIERCGCVELVDITRSQGSITLSDLVRRDSSCASMRCDNSARNIAISVTTSSSGDSPAAPVSVTPVTTGTLKCMSLATQVVTQPTSQPLVSSRRCVIKERLQQKAPRAPHTRGTASGKAIPLQPPANANIHMGNTLYNCSRAVR